MSARRATASRRDIHAEITNRLIALIEANPAKPVLPWRQTPMDLPVNALTKKPYRGINIVSLWGAAIEQGFATPIWASYRQWSELKCQVRAKEKSSPVIFYKEYDVNSDPEDVDDSGKRRVARASSVFNADQVDGFTPPAAQMALGPIDRIAVADAFVSATGARVEHGGQQAYYRPSTDHIQMPEEALFSGSKTMDRTEGYYAVLTHECIHWTGAKHRLNREFGQRFRDHAYAAEELVAEVGSAFLCAELGITQDTRDDHAQYLAHWLEMIKGDNRAIFTAAAKASEAVAFLKGFSPPS